MITIPALFSVDSYKLGHADQYPKGTQCVYSNFTPRSLKHFKVPEDFTNDTIIAYGMYDAICEIVDTFDSTFFSKPIDFILEEVQALYPSFTGTSDFNYERIRTLHAYGRLPLNFAALPEGAHVMPQIPVLVVSNTKPEFFWLTNFIETWLSNILWKPMVSATISWNYRQILEYYADYTGSDPAFVDWQAHDFSLRGMSGMEDGARTGVGHLLSFTGSDNVAAAWYAKQKYQVEPGELVAGSVPATEHSVMSCGSRLNELETFRRLITEVYPTGIVSIVSDTWDFWQVVTNYADDLADTITARDGKVVFRPDSGNPVDIICGTALGFDSSWERLADRYFAPGCYKDTSTGTFFNKDAKGSVTKILNPTAEMKGAVECLWEIFAGTTTSTGHRLLDSHVGLIYGDSITMDRANQILQRLADRWYASGNIVLGIGSYTFQYVTRDTIGAAMKATYAEVDGVSVDLYKDPATDPGKCSATGRLRVSLDGDNNYVVEDQQPWFDGGELYPILLDGYMVTPRPKLSEMRQRVREGNSYDSEQ